MAGKPKVYPVELVEAFEAALLARASIRSASEACGITKTVGRNIVARDRINRGVPIESALGAP